MNPFAGEAATLCRFLDAMPDAVVVADRQGRILMANAQAETLFGYERAEWPTLSVEDLMPERVRTRHRVHRESFHASPRLRAMGSGLALRARRKDGTEFPADIMLTPLETEREPMVCAAVRDLTRERNAELERRQMEQRLRQAERFAALGQLAARVARDLDLRAVQPSNGSSREEGFGALMRHYEELLAVTRQATVEPGSTLDPAEYATYEDVLSNLGTLLLGLAEFRHDAEELPTRTMLVADMERLRLVRALQDTVDVLKQTRHAFKSRALGQLRKRLELLLRTHQP
jgi:hypothetical protein